MNPRVVVDVGNSRIKWGLCGSDRLEALAAVPGEDRTAWEAQIERWGLQSPTQWILTGVHPRRRENLADWLRDRGEIVIVLTLASQLPIRVALEHPDKVGIDRLLDAVAALSRQRRGEPAIMVDAGSAVTVDWLTATGEFAGGTIFPGLRLMAQSLHDYTALLPVVEVSQPEPPMPGKSTIAAMQAGIYWTVAGGIRAISERMSAQTAKQPAIYLTGGDAALLVPALGERVQHWPEMTLEGLRISAETIS
jgi:type III pantothenate kinase